MGVAVPPAVIVVLAAATQSAKSRVLLTVVATVTLPVALAEPLVPFDAFTGVFWSTPVKSRISPDLPTLPVHVMLGVLWPETATLVKTIACAVVPPVRVESCCVHVPVVAVGPVIAEFDFLPNARTSTSPTVVPVGIVGAADVPAVSAMVVQEVVVLPAVVTLHVAEMLMIGSITYGVGSFESFSESDKVEPSPLSVQCVPFGVTSLPCASRITGLPSTIPDT